jgi:GNAT superfamily N-acetyltransferase
MDLSLGPLIVLRFESHGITTKETSTPNVSITRATSDDCEGILRCLRAAFEPYQAQYTRAGYEDTVMTFEAVRNRIENMTVLIARNEVGMIIGTIGAAVRGAEGHLRGMAVAPSSQGSGVAGQLLEAIETELAEAGCSFVTLDTTTPLLRATRFYERNGYVHSGAVSDFFGMPLYEYVKLLQCRSSESDDAG